MKSSPGVRAARLVEGLRQPHVAATWSLAEWDDAVRLGRRLRLLARLSASLEAAGLLAAIPPGPRRHLIGELRLSTWRTRAMSWAASRVGEALAPMGRPMVLLKGAAYVAQALPIAHGRMPADLDIMVPRESLDDAAARLRREGWLEVELDDHDRRYYREWSHELPPMRHPIHPIELDLHHAIVPPIARNKVAAEPLLARARPSGLGTWSTLQPTDQVLHCAAHLFFDSDARLRFRDLIDLDGMLRHFANAEPGFWPLLTGRAVELGLEEPLALALAFCVRWLNTPVPAHAGDLAAFLRPGLWHRLFLEPLLASLLAPTPPDAPPPSIQSLAAGVFLVRHHFNRMPLRLLLPHVWHKVRRSRESRPVIADPAAPNSG